MGRTSQGGGVPTVDPRRDAYYAAYALFEAVQSGRRDEALRELPAAAAAARRQGWTEVGIIVDAARVVHDLVAPGRSIHPDDITPLCRRAEVAGLTALHAVTLGLRGLASGTASDSMSLMADASRAVALLDDATQPPLDRCTGYVVAAGAFNTLRLWELVDDLYGRAHRLGADCEVPAMATAIAVNRVLTRVEWAVALLENGDDEQCAQRLAQAEAAVPQALGLDLPPLWRRDVEALSLVAALLGGTRPGALRPDVETCRQALVAAGDVETLPLLDAAFAVALWRDGDRRGAARACSRLSELGSASTGSHSFPSWVRAQVLTGAQSSQALRAQTAHAALLGRLRWQSRQAVLVSARAQIGAERRAGEHDRLVQAANTDALTGLHNRRAFDAWLGQRPAGTGEWATALLLLDIDGFKLVNDRYGHDVGDKVLRRVGQLLLVAVRPDDLAVRHGGDEFAVLLSGADLTRASAEQRARDLLANIEADDWEHVAPGLVVTASSGLALSAPGASWEATSLYRAADAALYRAKRGDADLVTADLATDGAPGLARTVSA